MSADTRAVSKPILAYKLLQTAGPRWVFYRLQLAAQQQLGLLERRLPLREWNDLSLAALLRPEVPNGEPEYAQWRSRNAQPISGIDLARLREPLAGFGTGCLAEAEGIMEGRFRLFSKQEFSFGNPPDWHLDPWSGQHASDDRHWSRIAPLGEIDIKRVWELNRHGWALVLARAFARTAEPRFAEGFWRLFSDWCEHNPPNRGANWMCGQETALRLMNVVLAATTMRATAPAQYVLLLRFVAASAERIAGHIGYARSQRNNHILSEAAGLWTASLLFPELKGASGWREMARAFLEEVAEQQVAADGAYIQHSFNYQRLALDLLVWCICLGRAHGEADLPAAQAALRRGAEFLEQMTDASEGHLPNYGPNDGACFLALSDVPFEDFRPAVQRSLAVGGRGASGNDESLIWLGLAPAAEPARPPRGSFASSSGYFTLRGAETWAMVRAGKYSSRPAQADQLHVDLWWRGINVACDPGAYSYNGEQGWKNALAGTAVHNTVTVDDEDQMLRATRFVWLDWAQGRLNHRGTEGDCEWWEGEHDGYARLGVTHRRALLRCGERGWVIVDDVLGSGTHSSALQWLLDPATKVQEGEDHLRLQIAAGKCRFQAWSSAPGELDVVHGTGSSSAAWPRGWVSRFYSFKQAASSVRLNVRAELPVRFVTVFAFASAEPIAIDVKGIQSGDLAAKFGAIGASPIILGGSFREGKSR